MQEMLSCKSQFETDIKNAIERAKWQQTVEDDAKESMPEFETEQQSQQFEEGMKELKITF